MDITCNDPRLLFEHQPHAVRELQAYFEPPAAARLGDETLYHAGENGVVVLTPNRQPPWVPITVTEYLQFKTAEIAAYRSNLTAAERGAPARLGDGRFNLAAGGTLARGKIVRLNPALSQGEKPTRRIQLIVVNVFANDQSLWDESAQALREVDYPTLRRLLR